VVSSDRKCRVVGVEDNPKLNFSWNNNEGEHKGGWLEMQR